MYKINIVDDGLKLKTVEQDRIKNFYPIYSNTEQFKYATGLFSTLEFEQIFSKLNDFLHKENAFLLEIETFDSGETIGLIKGLIVENEGIAWINSLAIITPFQSKGYGKKVIALIEKYFVENFEIKRVYLSVDKGNISGVNFWIKCGYEICDYIPGKELMKLSKDVRIMWKMLLFL